MRAARASRLLSGGDLTRGPCGPEARAVSPARAERPSPVNMRSEPGSVGQSSFGDVVVAVGVGSLA